MGFTKNGRKFFGGAINPNVTFKHVGTIKLTNGGIVDCTTNTSSYTAYRSGEKIGDLFLKDGTSICDCTYEYGTSGSTSNRAYYVGLCYGTSDVKETIEDYTLETTNLTGLNHAWSIAKDGFLLSFSNTCYNGTIEPITVKEIGLVVFPWVYEGSSPKKASLLYRKVLETPVTFLPDETYTFTLILK